MSDYAFAWQGGGPVDIEVINTEAQPVNNANSASNGPPTLASTNISASSKSSGNVHGRQNGNTNSTGISTSKSTATMPDRFFEQNVPIRPRCVLLAFVRSLFRHRSSTHPSSTSSLTSTPILTWALTLTRFRLPPSFIHSLTLLTLVPDFH